MVKKFKKRGVSARLKDNVWAADIPEIRPLFSKNQGAKNVLFVIEVFIK